MPTLNIPGTTIKSSQKRDNEERLLRVTKRRRRKEVDELLNAFQGSSKTCTLEEPPNVEPHLPSERFEIIDLKEKLRLLNEQNEKLLKEVKTKDATNIELNKKLTVLTIQNKKLLKKINELNDCVW